MGFAAAPTAMAQVPAAPPPAVTAGGGQQGNPASITATQNSSGIAAFVNGFVISNYDLDQRTALFIATSGIRPTTDNLPQIRAQVLRHLEEEVIALQEANKRRITVGTAEAEKAL